MVGCIPIGLVNQIQSNMRHVQLFELFFSRIPYQQTVKQIFASILL